MYGLLLAIFVIVSILLIVIVLMQRGRGSDVGAAFGGGMGQSIFGVGGVDTIFTKATYWLGAAFLILAILLTLLYPSRKGSIVENEVAPVTEQSTENVTPQEGGNNLINVPPLGDKSEQGTIGEGQGNKEGSGK